MFSGLNPPLVFYIGWQSGLISMKGFGNSTLTWTETLAPSIGLIFVLLFYYVVKYIFEGFNND